MVSWMPWFTELHRDSPDTWSPALCILLRMWLLHFFTPLLTLESNTDTLRGYLHSVGVFPSLHYSSCTFSWWSGLLHFSGQWLLPACWSVSARAGDVWVKSTESALKDLSLHVRRGFLPPGGSQHCSVQTHKEKCSIVTEETTEQR